MVGKQSGTVALSGNRIRTCVITRQRDYASNLIRLVLVGGATGEVRLVVDPTRTAPGRGMWVTPTAESLAAVLKRRAYRPALKVPNHVNVVDTTDIERAIAEWPKAAEAAGKVQQLAEN